MSRRLVQLIDGRHSGQWGLVIDVKLHAFTVEMADGEVSLSDHH